MKKIKIKKLYHSHISVRDYIVKSAIDNKEGLVVEYNDLTMTLPYEDLLRKFQFHSLSFKSKFSQAKTYQLIDFYFIPDKKLKESKF